MKKSLIIGHDGGLGECVLAEMNKISTAIRGMVDIISTPSIASMINIHGIWDQIVYCAGINLIAEFDKVTPEDLQRSMTVNCFGFIELIHELRFAKKLAPHARICIVTSNAANIPMSHSLAYNCSKAAANMAIRQIAREIRVEEFTIFGVAPNKLAGTPMSRDIEHKVCAMRGWTPEQAVAYQLAALPARCETEPAHLARFIRQMMSGDHIPYLHGTILPYGGPQQ